MKLGAHISISKGLLAVADKAKVMGANCVQIFASPPRNWNPSKFTQADFEEFGRYLQKLTLVPNFLHGIYLVNLHTQNPDQRSKAIESVVSYLKIADWMGAEGVVIHSHRPDPVFVGAVDEIIGKAQTKALLII